jgi:hypothetical protein
VSAEEIAAALARSNPVDDENYHKCRFCLTEAPKGTAGLEHTDDCIWVAAVQLVLV